MVDPSRIAELQKFYQNPPKTAAPFVHLIGKGDRLTSVVLPLGICAVGAAVLVKGYYGMITGTSKLE